MNRLLAASLGLLVTSSCATGGGGGADATTTLHTDGLCWWQGVRWGDGAPLQVRGTNRAFARAHADWVNGAYQGATLNAVLRRDNGKAVLEGEWSGGGLSLLADVDVAQFAVFSVWDPTRVPGGLMLRNASARVLDASTGQALIAPSTSALEAFVSDPAPSASVRCEALALRASRPGSTDETDLLARGGFKTAREVSLSPEADVGGVAAFESPGGRFLGAFLPAAGARAFEVDRREGQVRVVVVKDFVLWVGWVDAARVVEAKRVVGNLLGAARQQPEGTWRTCSDDLPLFLGSTKRRVGVLKANTPFLVVKGGLSDEGTVIHPGVAWFEATEQELLTTAAVIECAQASARW